MTDATAIARRLYADISKTVTRSLTAEAVLDRYSLFGASLDAVIAASNGYLRLRSPGFVEAIRQEPAP